MKIAIVTLATESYYDNLPTLFNSLDLFFLKNHEKKIFFFTDRVDGGLIRPNRKSIHIDALPWPLITLLRFKNILSIKYELEQYDLIYYIDSDCVVNSEITEEIFPDEENQIVATKHPWQTSAFSDIYEKNPESTAAVLNNKWTPYFQACFFGAFTRPFLKMAQTIHTNITWDLKRNIIAKWHDESHLNCYLVDNPYKALNCGYAYPDPERYHQTFSVDMKIIHRNKAAVL